MQNLTPAQQAFLKKIRKLIIEKIEIEEEEIQFDSLLSDLMDSLCAIEIIDSVEKEYNIQISDGEIKGLKRVGDIIDYLEKKEVQVV